VNQNVRRRKACSSIQKNFLVFFIRTHSYIISNGFNSLFLITSNPNSIKGPNVFFFFSCDISIVVPGDISSLSGFLVHTIRCIIQSQILFSIYIFGSVVVSSNWLTKLRTRGIPLLAGFIVLDTNYDRYRTFSITCPMKRRISAFGSHYITQYRQVRANIQFPPSPQ
jgi:hypothetical protein